MRVNLAVPYHQKDEAKKRGARWDHVARTWYVEDLENLSRFLKWMPEATRNPTATVRKRRRSRPVRALEIRKGERIIGKDYRPSCGQCDVPPWEVCPCSFDEHMTAAQRANQEADEAFQRALDLEKQA